MQVVQERLFWHDFGRVSCMHTVPSIGNHRAIDGDVVQHNYGCSVLIHQLSDLAFADAVHISSSAKQIVVE